MLVSPRTLNKLSTLESLYADRIFRVVAPVPVRCLETKDHRRSVPSGDEPWRDAPAGTHWGAAWGSAWFAGVATVPDECDGRELYVRANTDGVETLVWVDGVPRGLFNHLTEAPMRGKHHALRVAAAARAGDRIGLAFEAYAGHPIPGTQPRDVVQSQDGAKPPRFDRVFGGVDLLEKRDDVAGFVFDLRTLTQLVRALPADSFRRGKIAAGLERVFALVTQQPDVVEESVWRAPLAAARDVMRPLLASTNSASAPVAGITGHSHMDTAWLWTVAETARKCARTYSNVLTLMEQYPDYRFVQSSSYHLELMRRHYPAVFEGIRQRVVEGRWEINGGTWIEPDCSLTGGEAFVRHFLRGQRFTREQFGVTGDTFWVPDSFGFSAALPQILAGCGIRYFCTTKLSWNDTATFPHDTFQWVGIDGTSLLAHFSEIHCAPDPATLISRLHGGERDYRSTDNWVLHKDVTDRRLIAFGCGDGGGGPDYEMLEMARRAADVEGCPRAVYTRVGDFLHNLERDCPRVPSYHGELYLEGHRGTLTTNHRIKRLNRALEMALREAEFVDVCAGGVPPQELAEMWDVLLLNQFHDILPGTSIAEVHDQAVAELETAVNHVRSLTQRAASRAVSTDDASLTLFNSLGWVRRGPLELTGLTVGQAPVAATAAQVVTDPDGVASLVVQGLDLPPLGATSFELGPTPSAPSPFFYDGTRLATPHLLVTFDASGAFTSLVHRATGRELRGAGHPLNTFLFGEDIPAAWDNWDIDADLDLKLTPCAVLIGRNVVADGPLQFRLRTSLAVGASRIVQDTVFHAHTARIDFDTRVEWNSPHHFLKTAFGLALNAPSSRHEVAFGHVERPTHRNTPWEQARFEGSQHKWSDVSETRFGVALLNDGKYGVSVLGAEMRLSLLKGGCHPDPRGDVGRHAFRYALLPHDGGFSVESVVRPAYEFNVPVTAVAGRLREACPSLLTLDGAPNVVCETVKRGADGTGLVVRLYEAERSAARAGVAWGRDVGAVSLTNLIEEESAPMPNDPLNFAAFQIRTLSTSGGQP